MSGSIPLSLSRSLDTLVFRRVHRPLFQIFAANTGVGKTVISAGLLHVAQRDWSEFSLRYLKPAQTGYPVDSDTRFVKQFAPKAQTKDLFTYRDAVGPHLAAQIENRPVSDQEFLRAVTGALNAFDNELSTADKSLTLVETAGGVNSPGLSGTLQSELYRPFRFPTVLVGDSKLGGISTTLTAYESLMLRGYDTVCLVMFGDEKYVNHEAIQRHLGKVPVVVVPPPPSQLHDNPQQDLEQMKKYFAAGQNQFGKALQNMMSHHSKTHQRLLSSAEKSKDKFWWPFTQHGNPSEVSVIDSAYGDNFSIFNGSSDAKNPALQFDSCGSWWTQGVGHGNPAMAREVAYAAGRYGHVIFPESTHEPALQLAETLLDGVGKGWASRVFFSDNGSTAVEVALKMAFRKAETQAQLSDDIKFPWEIIGIEDSYHGDTIGAMDAASPNAFNKRTSWYQGRGFWFSPPTVLMKNGQLQVSEGDGSTKISATFQDLEEVFSPTRDASNLYREYTKKIEDALEAQRKKERHFGALLIEPVIHGSGGMIFIDPLFQRALIRVCKRLRIPVIFDEIFVGLYRLGPESTAALLHETPDIACFGKLLSGGVTPIAVTLSTEDIFETFKGTQKIDCLLHGHSYTAFPVGCWAAVQALQHYKTHENYDPASNRFAHLWDAEAVKRISSLSGVTGVVSMGSLFAVTLQAREGGYNSTAASEVTKKLRTKGVFARPLGATVYLMASPSSRREDCKAQLELLEEIIANRGCEK